MRPRVTYWTGTWDPEREAISKEVEILRRSHDRRASVVAFSPGNRSALVPTDGVWRLSGRQWIAFRALAACIEPQGQVTHAFGHLDGWHLLRSLGRRPFVFTVVVSGKPLEPRIYDRVSVFAAESEPIAAGLRTAGIADDRIRVVYPGVDLVRFSPAPMPPKVPFRLLFAIRLPILPRSRPGGLRSSSNWPAAIGISRSSSYGADGATPSGPTINSRD